MDRTALPLRVSLGALALLAIVPFAFWPGYLSKPGLADASTHAHAVLGTAWLLLLVVQPLLVRASLRSVHRRIGRIALLVGAAFFVSGVLVAQRSIARMGAEQFAREGRDVYLPLAMAALFVVALLSAVHWRHHPALHARFMAATALPLLDPLIARLLFIHAPPLPAPALYQLPAFALTAALVAAMLASLPAASAGRRAFATFAAGVAVLLLGFFAVPHTGAWQAFAAWFRALPLP